MQTAPLIAQPQKLWVGVGGIAENLRLLKRIYKNLQLGSPPAHGFGAKLQFQITHEAADSEWWKEQASMAVLALKPHK